MPQKFLTTAKSPLSGCPQYLLNNIEKVQNNAACHVLSVPNNDHIFPHLASLHWLPIDSRIQYKLAFLCPNFLNSTDVCLTELLTVYKPARQLRSSSASSILCAHALAWTKIFFLCYNRLSGTVSLAKLGNQTHSNLSNNFWNLASSSYRKFVLTVLVLCFVLGYVPHSG